MLCFYSFAKKNLKIEHNFTQTEEIEKWTQIAFSACFRSHFSTQSQRFVTKINDKTIGQKIWDKTNKIIVLNAIIV